MARAPFQILLMPFRRGPHGEYEFAVFRTTDDYWQGIAGGGEDRETPLQATRREALEEAGIPESCALYSLSTTTTVPAFYFPCGRHWPADTYVVPEYAFAVRCDGIALSLSREHTEFRWVTAESARRLLLYDSNRCAVWELSERLRRHDLPAPAGVHPQTT